MRTPRTLLIALAVLLIGSSSALATTVWKWVDKNGVTHYSDQPVPGAVEVNVNAQTYDASEAQIPETQRSAPRTPPAQQAQYTSVEIVSPSNEQTIVGTGGAVSVSVRVTPGMRYGHVLQIHMDGQLMSEPESNATSLQLTNVPRGAHTLTASITTPEGQVLLRSAPVTFFVQQPSVLRRN